MLSSQPIISSGDVKEPLAGLALNSAAALVQVARPHKLRDDRTRSLTRGTAEGLGRRRANKGMMTCLTLGRASWRTQNRRWFVGSPATRAIVLLIGSVLSHLSHLEPHKRPVVGDSEQAPASDILEQAVSFQRRGGSLVAGIFPLSATRTFASERRAYWHIDALSTFQITTFSAGINTSRTSGVSPSPWDRTSAASGCAGLARSVDACHITLSTVLVESLYSSLAWTTRLALNQLPDLLFLDPRPKRFRPKLDEIAPFGTSLGGLETILGIQTSSCWLLYPSHDFLSTQLYKFLYDVIRYLSDNDRRAIEVGRLFGLFRTHGFDRQPEKENALPLEEGDQELVCLEGFCLRLASPPQS
ncbi:hypothetical protein TOPH_07495 [Tolypocladium ophioglossoides CBS 100239]|uniref:Uncharacterized protein n=1 Tax=Tolypocladium ophioglossoides (strain CBS 100239) TaxID=1163406 RepID=A0A0L0N1G2_TOLOC|nr:hypothetical protein TOPH_07495 [Tolypocladium ophioglossoides CBS 100239]